MAKKKRKRNPAEKASCGHSPNSVPVRIKGKERTCLWAVRSFCDVYPIIRSKTNRVDAGVISGVSAVSFEVATTMKMHSLCCRISAAVVLLKALALLQASYVTSIHL